MGQPIWSFPEDEQTPKLQKKKKKKTQKTTKKHCKINFKM